MLSRWRARVEAVDLALEPRKALALGDLPVRARGRVKHYSSTVLQAFGIGHSP